MQWLLVALGIKCKLLTMTCEALYGPVFFRASFVTLLSHPGSGLIATFLSFEQA